MLVTNKAYDSLSDEEGCKSVTSYVLAHKDARQRGQGRLLSYNCILRAFNFMGERNLEILMNTSSYCVCVFFRNWAIRLIGVPSFCAAWQSTDTGVEI